MITCQFEDKHGALLRHVTVDGIVAMDNKILLVRRADGLLEGGKYALPGGYLDRDETTEEGVLREVLEETGYRGKIVELFAISDKPDRGDDRQNVSFFYIIEASEKTGEPDKESKEVAWFDLNALPDSSEVAFDHYEAIGLFKGYKKEQFKLPVIMGR